MALTINTNSSAATATMHLSKNNAALKKSLNRLSSGTRIVQPVDDAGGLAVSMKLESSIVRLAGAQKNIQNAQSFLEVQDGILSSAGKILNRMVELKGLSEDVMKNDSDKANYNREFQDLQMQIYDLAQTQFNGVSLFAVRDSDSAVGDTVIINDLGSDNTLSVFASASGASGPTVSVNKAALLSALTIDTGDLATGQAYQTKDTGDVRSFAAAAAKERTSPVSLVWYACPVAKSPVSIVNAESKAALFTLTVGPLAPLALANTLSVLSEPRSLIMTVSPTALSESLTANRLTPLNCV